MVRLADLPEYEREHFLAKVPALPAFPGRPFVKGPPLAARRVAIVTTAGLHRRTDRPFAAGAGGMDYRVIPGDTPAGELSVSHVSVNFDRTGMQADWNVAFPLDRLKELARDGIIGSVAAFHYSFMGAISPVTKYEAKARELAGMLRKDRVDAVVLSPV